MPMPERDNSAVIRLRLVEEYLANPSLTMRALGRRHGMSRSGVSYHLRAAGIDTRDRSDYHRSSKAEMVFERAAGDFLREIGARRSISHAEVSRKLLSIGVTQKNVRLVNRLKPAQRKIYCEAVDVDRLPHMDAIEVALDAPEPQEGGK